MKFVFFKINLYCNLETLNLIYVSPRQLSYKHVLIYKKKMFSLLPRYLHNREFYIYKEVIFQINVIVCDAQTFDSRDAL